VRVNRHASSVSPHCREQMGCGRKHGLQLKELGIADLVRRDCARRAGEIEPPERLVNRCRNAGCMAGQRSAVMEVPGSNAGSRDYVHVCRHRHRVSLGAGRASGKHAFRQPVHGIASSKLLTYTRESKINI
jgi:hypothetical protein